jgi:hypothetical protein
MWKVVGRCDGSQHEQTLQGEYASELMGCVAGERVRWKVEIGRGDSLRTYATEGVWTLPNYGPELMTNWNFENPPGTKDESGWFVGGGATAWTVGSGSEAVDWYMGTWARIVGGGWSGLYATIGGTLIEGRTYRVTYWLSKTSGVIASMKLMMGNVEKALLHGSYGVYDIPWTKYTADFVCPALGGSQRLLWEYGANPLLNAYVDGVSLREVIS